MQSSGYYEITTIDLKTTNPYLPDRFEFKHQFVKFMAGHAISGLCYLKKECFNPLHHLLVERGRMLGFDHTQGKFTDMWTLSENLRSDVETTFFVSNHYDGFFCQTKVTIFGTC